MSKSKGNVVDPDDMIQKFGADALRLYVMFVAPPEKEIEWTDAGLEGSFRFLARVWRLVDQLCGDDRRRRHSRPRRRAAGRRRARAAAQDARDDPPRHARPRSARAPEHRRLGADGARQRALRLLREERVRAARATSAEDEGDRRRSSAGTVAVLKEAVEALVLMLSPFAPHMAEELWEELGHRGGVTAAGLAAVSGGGRAGGRDHRAGPGQRQGPRAPDGAGRDRATTTCGRRRCRIRRSQRYVEGKTVRKVVVAGGASRLVSIVVS